MTPVIIGGATLYCGDCIEVMRTMPDNSVDSVVCDPPYELGFMGRTWDSTGIANSVTMWAEALRVLKPGGHLLAFSGSRTYHRMACAIEDAGFDIRDQIMWVYGSGFPKSLDVSKAIDKAAGEVRAVVGAAADFERDGATRKIDGSRAKPHSKQGGHGYGDRWSAPVTAPASDAARQWDGWGTALKPAHEPICMARKPLIGTVAANVLQHGVGALNIDACRVGWPDGIAPEIGTPGWGGPAKKLTTVTGQDGATVERSGPSQIGRWPANLIHDGNVPFPNAAGQQGALTGDEPSARPGATNCFGPMNRGHVSVPRDEADKSAARFFYCAKASRADRHAGLIDPGAQLEHGSTLRDAENLGENRKGNHHPTVKPTDLMAYLVRLVTPAGGVVLDPFMGSGSTGKACVRESMNFIGIDLGEDYFEIAKARIQYELLKPLQKEMF